MPKLSGINFYKSLNQKPMVVFTTAYPEFAVEGFELDATDYLLKPFSFERFVKAVNKVKEKSIYQTDTDEKYILLKADRKVYKVDFSEILFFEALGDYVKAHLQDKVLIVTTTLKKLMEELPSSAFMRTHKSYIIAKSKIEYLEGNQIQLPQHKIPIGQSYREEVLKKLESWITAPVTVITRNKPCDSKGLWRGNPSVLYGRITVSEQKFTVLCGQSPRSHSKSQVRRTCDSWSISLSRKSYHNRLFSYQIVSHPWILDRIIIVSNRIKSYHF